MVYIFIIIYFLIGVVYSFIRFKDDPNTLDFAILDGCLGAFWPLSLAFDFIFPNLK